MDSKVLFGRWEATCLMISLIGTKVIINYTRAVTETAGTAGWIMAIYTTILALAGFAIIQRLYARYEGKDVLDIGELAAGMTGRVILGSMIAILLFLVVETNLRQFGEQMKVMGLQNSPLSFVIFFFAAAMVVAAYVGIEAIVRFQAVFVVVSILGFFTYIFLLGPYYEFENMTPLFGTGPYNIFVKGFPKISEFSELIVLFLIVPFIKNKENFNKVGYYSIAISGFFMACLSLAYICIFPYPIAKENFLPVYQMGRLVSYGRFFQRVESLFLTTWAIMGFMYLSAGFYFILLTIKKTFKLEYYRPLILPLIIIIFSTCLLPPYLMSTVDLIIIYVRTYSWLAVFVIIPLVLWGAGRKKRLAAPPNK